MKKPVYIIVNSEETEAITSDNISNARLVQGHLNRTTLSGWKIVYGEEKTELTPAYNCAIIQI